MKRPLIILSVLALAALLTFGFWPLAADDMAITFDKEMIAAKKDYLTSLAPADSAQRPNIIIILADDLGKHDISLYGSKLIQTPNIDAIGQRGVTFQQGYITSPICAPSRAGLLTGRYQQRYGFEYQPHERYPKNRLELFVYGNFIAKGDWLLADQKRFPPFSEMVKMGMPPSEILLSEILQARGYATGIMGKWHLGAGDHAIPSNRGFDTQYGFYEAYSLYMADTSDPSIVNQRHSDFSDPFIWGKGRTGTCAIRWNNEVIEEKYYLTDRIAEEANTFITAHANEPFFLYVPFLAPHTPFQATKAYYDKLGHIKDRNQRVYNAMILQLDDAVGSIIRHLEQQGLAQNTLIFFLSDNGGAHYTHATDNAPHKGGKFTNFEGGLNVPFLLRWDARIAPNSTYAHAVSTLDVVPTVLQATATPMPTDRPFDGRPLLPHLADGTPAHNALYWRSGYSLALRHGQWKLITDLLGGSTALYDLSTDPHERNDLHAQLPDTVQLLLQHHRAWQADMQPPSWPRIMDFRYRDGEREFWFPL